MVEQQCPNCGGYKSKSQFGFEGAFGLAVLAGVGCFLIGVPAFILLTKNAASNVSGFLNVGVISIVVALSVFLISFIYSRTRQNNYACRICGYKWDLRDIPTKKQIQVKSDLIKKGNILLEQEEAERRRQSQWQQ